MELEYPSINCLACSCPLTPDQASLKLPKSHLPTGWTKDYTLDLDSKMRNWIKSNFQQQYLKKYIICIEALDTLYYNIISKFPSITIFNQWTLECLSISFILFNQMSIVYNLLGFSLADSGLLLARLIKSIDHLVSL